MGEGIKARTKTIKRSIKKRSAFLSFVIMNDDEHYLSIIDRLVDSLISFSLDYGRRLKNYKEKKKRRRKRHRDE
jgi:hypothetical protein